jgi:hypothetical protein
MRPTDEMKRDVLEIGIVPPLKSMTHKALDSPWQSSLLHRTFFRVTVISTDFEVVWPPELSVATAVSV